MFFHFPVDGHGQTVRTHWKRQRILPLTWQSSSVQVRFNISLSSCRSKMTHFLHSVKMAGNEHTLLKHEKPPRRNFSTNFNYSSEVDIEGLVDETTNIGHSSRSTFAWWRSSQLLYEICGRLGVTKPRTDAENISSDGIFFPAVTSKAKLMFEVAQRAGSHCMGHTKLVQDQNLSSVKKRLRERRGADVWKNLH